MTIQQRFPQRVRNELRFRELTVLRVERVGAGFQRIVLGGEQLTGFTSLGFDDHCKIFFPKAEERFIPPVVTDDGIVWGDGPRPPSRDYTPLYDASRHELSVDFYLHNGGIASVWARNAQPGDSLTIGGPRGSLVVPEDYAWQLYITDESGMPALRLRLEQLSQLTVRPHITAIVSVNDAAYQDYMAHLRGVDIRWVVGHQLDGVAEALANVTLPAEDYFIWLTGEGEVVKSLINRFESAAIDTQFMRAQAYWHKK